jgi:RNA recognition motif-containing protein
MSNKRISLFVKNFVIPNQPYECSEESLRILFEPFGRVKNIYIPKDFQTRRTKGYAFVNFFLEEDAQKAQQVLNNSVFQNKSLIVTFAHESQPGSEKKYRQRSRSPRPHRSPISSGSSNLPSSRSSSEADHKLQSEVNSLKKKKDELKKKINEINQDCDKLRKEAKDLNERRKYLKNELNIFRNKKNIFLPCGHSKFIELQESAVLDELINHASSHLSVKEAENSNIQKQVRSKVIAILAYKFPDTFKCREKVSFIIGKCGHMFETECFLISAYKKGDKVIECVQHIEKLLPCGHTQLIECYKEMDFFVCKKC